MKLSNETKKLLRESHIGILASEESKLKMSLARTGDKNHFYGKNHTEESKALIREKRKNFVYSEELKAKISFNTKMSKNPNAKKVENLVTKEIYGCIKEAALANNIKPELLERYLKGIIENKTNLQYLDESLRPKNKKYSYKNILVLDLNTGVYYYSIKEATIFHNMHKTELSSMLTGKKKNKTSLIKC